MNDIKEKDDSTKVSSEKVATYDTEIAPVLDMTVTQMEVAAEENAKKEVEQTIWQSVKACKWGLFWCFSVSLCVIMEGCDGGMDSDDETETYDGSDIHDESETHDGVEIYDELDTYKERKTMFEKTAISIDSITVIFTQIHALNLTFL